MIENTGKLYFGKIFEPIELTNIFLADGACYKDSNDRILKTHIGDFKDSNSMEVCIAACEGYKYAGTQYSHQCFCGNDEPDPALVRPSAECKSVCPGNAEEKCGASWRMNIYDVSGKYI